MKFKTVLLTFILLLSLITFGQTKKDLDIDFMLRASIYAQSSIEDSLALGGFAESENFPKTINKENDFAESGLFLKIDTSKDTTTNNRYNGYKFYIGNKSDTIVKLDASDSRLSVIAEVFYKKKWQPIEYLPRSWCGNSYHEVYLKQNEYWEFIVPKFSGKIKTKLRYKLIIGSEKYIYSNEIVATFNKSQLEQKQGHKSEGIMDPYND